MIEVHQTYRTYTSSFIDPSCKEFLSALKFAIPPCGNLFLDSFLWSKAWAHRSYRVIEFLEGGSKFLVSAGHGFNSAVFLKRNPDMHGLEMYENRHFKRNFLNKFVTNEDTEKAGGYRMYGWYVFELYFPRGFETCGRKSENSVEHLHVPGWPWYFCCGFLSLH